MTDQEKKLLKKILYKMTRAIPFEYNVFRSAVERDINTLCLSEQEQCERLIKLCNEEKKDD